MATIQRFEDLEIWKKARSFSNLIYPLTFKDPISSDFRYKDQIRGSCGAIMDNITEGFERGSRLKFINALTTAKGEIGELKSELFIGLDNLYFSEKDFQEFYQLADEITKMVTSPVIHLNKTDFKGQKFKGRK